MLPDALTGGAIGEGANRNNPDAITNYLDSGRDIMLDVDSNGNADAIADGIPILPFVVSTKRASQARKSLGALFDLAVPRQQLAISN